MSGNKTQTIKRVLGHDHIPDRRWLVLVKRLVLGGLCLAFAWLWRETLGVWPAIGVGALGLLLIDPELVGGAVMAGIRPLKALKALKDDAEPQ